MYWIISAALVLVGGFISAFILSEWIARGRATSLRDRLRPYESELLPYDAIPWDHSRAKQQSGQAFPSATSGAQSLAASSEPIS
jgi:hypothetical protein